MFGIDQKAVGYQNKPRDQADQYYHYRQGRDYPAGAIKIEFYYPEIAGLDTFEYYLRHQITTDDEEYINANEAAAEARNGKMKHEYKDNGDRPEGVYIMSKA